MTSDTFDPATVLENMRAVPREAFADARPFSHVVLNGLFPQAEIGSIHSLLPALSDDYWDKSNDEGI